MGEICGSVEAGIYGIRANGVWKEGWQTRTRVCVCHDPSTPFFLWLTLTRGDPSCILLLPIMDPWLLLTRLDVLTHRDSLCVSPLPITDIWLLWLIPLMYYIYCAAVEGRTLGSFFLWIQEVLSIQTEPPERGQAHERTCWAARPDLLISYRLSTPRVRRRYWWIRSCQNSPPLLNQTTSSVSSSIQNSPTREDTVRASTLSNASRLRNNPKETKPRPIIKTLRPVGDSVCVI